MSDQLSTDLASLRIQRDEPPRRSRAGWIVAGVLVLGAGGLLAVGSLLLGPRIFKTEVEVTEIRMISPAQASVQVTSTGYVVAQSASEVGARLPGRVAEVLVKEGETVAAGQPIVRLDDAEQRTAIATSRARVFAARARAQSARASLLEARQQLERERELAAKGASPRSVAEDLDARVTALDESAHAAEAEAEAAAAELRQLEVNLEFMTIVAPIPGVVVAKPVGLGEMVGGASMAPVARIADFSTLMVETDVPEARLALVRVGGPTEIVLDAYPTVRHRGRVAEISPRVNRVKATVIVRVAFADPVEGVLPDMSARVGFLSEELDPEAAKVPPKLFVPGSAVTLRGADRVVFRVDDGRARQERVRLGPELGAGYELLEGPAEGTRIIAEPPLTLGDGFPIRERNE